MDLFKYYESCNLCPRSCGVSRSKGGERIRLGYCGEEDEIRVAYVGPHFGEEPPITGSNGSGTIFFSGCTLRCSFCQNYQISSGGLGTRISVEELVKRVLDMVKSHHVHNINLVTPDHFYPHVFRLVSLLRKEGLDLPVVYNVSGYQSVEMLRLAEGLADIYLPDYKYSDSSLAAKLSRCPDYPMVALEAISEMVRQKGFLDSFLTGSPIAMKGVLVRHLILPGNIDNSIKALTSLLVEFGRGLPLSIMSQYHPVLEQEDESLNRSLTGEEFREVYTHAKELGFEHLFVQFPKKAPQRGKAASRFLPDFRQAKPFGY
jgi:putative pyruvate formate lyase activating enzyme